MRTAAMSYLGQEEEAAERQQLAHARVVEQHREGRPCAFWVCVCCVWSVNGCTRLFGDHYIYMHAQTRRRTKVHEETGGEPPDLFHAVVLPVLL